jgi:hypothetical protein
VWRFTFGDSLLVSPPPREPVVAESLAQRNGTGQCAAFRACACVQARPMIHLKCGTSQKSVPDRGEIAAFFAALSGWRLYWRPEFAMFRIGQHCCPN